MFISSFFRCGFFLSLVIVAIANAEAKTKTSSPETITQLPQVTVIAKDDSADGEVVGYKTGTSRSSTRTETSLLNTPQSVSVITQDQIRDQNISNIGEAIRYVPGITLHQGENNRDQVIIRGNSSSADFFIDGARDDVQYFRDFYNIDRVEVLKGPNAMAFGRGGSGGLINRVSKTANGERVRQLVVSGGSFDNRRFQADIGDKVDDTLSLRVNTMYEKSGTFRQYGNLERYGFNPTATFNLAKKTDLKVGYEYFHDSRFNDRGIPSQNGAAYKTNPSTFFGNPNLNHSDATINSGFAILSHEFTPTLKLRNYTRYTDNQKFYQNVYAGGAVQSNGNVAISSYNNAVNRQNFTNQTDLTKKFSTGTFNHTALMGMEIARQYSQTLRMSGSAVPAVTVSNPLTFAPITFSNGASDANNNSEADIYAGYLQDQIDLTKQLQVTVGVRYDIFQLKFHDNHTGSNFSRTDGLFSPRVGIVFKPKDSVSIYGSYSVSHLPSSGDQFSTLNDQLASLKPEDLQNYEIGTKWDVNPKLNLTTAIYQLDRTNTRAINPANPTTYVLSGASRTRGLEIGATGQATNKWQIIAAYAFQDARIVSSTSLSTANSTKSTSGAHNALVPKNMGSLWNKYNFTNEWAAAIGTIYQSDQFAAIDNRVRLKGFTRFDGAAYYKINSDYRLQMNAENLFGRRYIQTADGNNNIQPGSPRAFKVSLVANF